MRKLLFLLITVGILVVIPTIMAQDAPETEVQFIELTGPASIRDAEISSLTWYGDYLLLITENPFIYASDGNVGKFYALDKQDILDYLAADVPEPLEPWPVPLYGDDILDAVGGYAVEFDGFEAAAVQTGLGYFVDDQIYLTIEADSREDDTMRGYLVSGTIMPGLSGINLHLNTFIDIPRQTDFNNMSYESLMLVDGDLIAIHEVNHVDANPDNVAYKINLLSGELTTVDILNIPYRITDTTEADENGVFWGINYFFPGEGFLGTDTDPLFEQYGRGASQTEFGRGINSDHPDWGGVERLVAFQYSDDGITMIDQAPIQLLQTEESNGRNWEGLARLDDMGFLVVTDKYPSTLLGFVPNG